MYGHDDHDDRRPFGEQVKAAMSDPEKAKRLAADVIKQPGFRLWGSFVIFAFVIFWLLSSGEFSFLLTLSSLVSMFSFLMVLLTIYQTSSVNGVSVKMMECYILVFACRSFAVVPWEGYLPFDKSGDWFYQLCEVLCFVLACVIVFCIRKQFASTHDAETDNFNHALLIAPAFGISLFLHPHLNNFLPSDIAWAFALYLESVTVLPQLLMFMKEGKAQVHTTHFLAAQALSRMMSFVFWASSFSELSNPNHFIKQFVGNWVVVIQLLQLIIMGDFIYHYVRCLRQGISVSEVLNTMSMNV